MAIYSTTSHHLCVLIGQKMQLTGYHYGNEMPMQHAPLENFLKIHRIEIVWILTGNRMDLLLSIIVVYFHIIDIVSK